MTPTIQALADGLSGAQRSYLDAVADSPKPYEPRHGRCANTALRRGMVDTIVVLNDGREGAWDSFDVDDWANIGIRAILGQRLTPLGLAVRRLLQEREGRGHAREPIETRRSK